MRRSSTVSRISNGNDDAPERVTATYSPSRSTSEKSIVQKCQSSHVSTRPTYRGRPRWTTSPVAVSTTS